MPKHKLTLTINTEENDDWMKSLKGYQNELKIHDELRKKHSKKKGILRKKKNG